MFIQSGASISMAEMLQLMGRYGLKMWKVAANVLSKLSQTADSGSPAASGLGGGLTALFIYIIIYVMKCYAGHKWWYERENTAREVFSL